MASLLISILSVIGAFFLEWGKIFLAPLKNIEMFWIVVPVYLSWILTEIYQEKKFTSLGNAISNGVIVLWAGIDWIRYTLRLIAGGELSFGADLMIKFFIAFIILTYGLFIIITGIKVKKITRYVGRIREVSYVLLMFTPIFYGVIPVTLKTFGIIILGFPIFYGIVEIIDRITPTPKTYDEENQFARETESKGELDLGLGESSESSLDKELKDLKI